MKRVGESGEGNGMDAMQVIGRCVEGIGAWWRRRKEVVGRQRKKFGYGFSLYRLTISSNIYTFTKFTVNVHTPSLSRRLANIF